MFFDDLSSVFQIARRVGFSIFVLPENFVAAPKTKKVVKTAAPSFLLPSNSLEIEPDKGQIRVDQIREVEDFMTTKQTNDQFIVVRHAEKMNPQAENAALKLLEEPKDNYHIVFLTTSLANFLPTILSRAAIFVYKVENPLDQPPAADTKTLDLAKRMITASPRDLGPLVEELTKSKSPREEVLKTVETAIELIYKSYFKTGNSKLLKKLPNLLKLYNNLRANGHIKLQLWANLC